MIITSAYEEYALQGFELAVCGYLLKPFRFDRFLQAVNRAYAQFNQTQPLPSSSATPQNPAQLAVKTDKEACVRADLQSVFYLESLGNYVKKVWQENYLLTARTLSSYETELPADTFVHKSYILNRKMIHALEGNIVLPPEREAAAAGENYKHAVNLK